MTILARAPQVSFAILAAALIAWTRGDGARHQGAAIEAPKASATDDATGPRRSDSIAVELGPDVTVPLNSGSGDLSVEPSVATRDSVVVVSWNDSHGGHIELGNQDVGTAVSIDRTLRAYA